MSWTLEKIKELLEIGREEALTLDYKDSRALDNKKELAKDVSAFANSAGGIIIYGVQEKGNKPISLDDGVSPHNKMKESIESSLIDRIKPKIQGIVIHPIDLPTGNQLFVLEIPQSHQAPHMADNRYHKRYNFNSVAMEHYEVMDIMNRQKGPDIWLIFKLLRSEYEVSNPSPTIRFDAQIENRSVFPAKTAIITFWFENNLKFPETINSSCHPQEFLFEDDQRISGFKKVFDVNPITPIFGTQGFGFTNPQNRFDTFLDVDITQEAMQSIGPYVSPKRQQELRARIKWEIQAPYMTPRQGFATLIIGPDYDASTQRMPVKLEQGSKELMHPD